MIISATRITARSGHRALADHVWRGPGNTAVLTLRGSEADLSDMVATARSEQRRFAIRHYQISPGECMNDAAALEIVDALAAEFGFDAEAVVLIRHDKPRRVTPDPLIGTQGHDQHWHLLVPEVDPVTLRVLDSAWMYPRHERVAREAELRLVHKVTKGRWNTSVVTALRRRGQASQAQSLVSAGITERRPAYAAYTSTQRRQLERRHAAPRGGRLDLPDLVRTLQQIWAEHAIDLAALGPALRQHGLRLRHPQLPLPTVDAGGRSIAPAPETRSSHWVVDAYDGEARTAYVLGSASRLLHAPAATIAWHMQRKAASPVVQPPSAQRPPQVHTRSPSAPATKPAEPNRRPVAYPAVATAVVPRPRPLERTAENSVDPLPDDLAASGPAPSPR